MQAVWEDTEHEQRGLFPVYLYQNDGTQNPADFYKCSCGIDCTSGACCCYLGPSQLSCAPAGAASCGTSEHSSNTPGRDSVVSSQVPTELLTLAIAASSIEGSRVHTMNYLPADHMTAKCSRLYSWDNIPYSRREMQLCARLRRKHANDAANRFHVQHSVWTQRPLMVYIHNAGPVFPKRLSVSHKQICQH